jgi:hypothetical protein
MINTGRGSVRAMAADTETMQEGGGVSRTIRRDALDKKAGMNLAEMAAFVQDAMRLDVPGNVVPKPRMGWKGQIEGLMVTWGTAP